MQASKLADGVNGQELPPESVTTKGNQRALGHFITQAREALDADDTEEALNKIEKALSRTDGCVLRGEVDGNGPGRDWNDVSAGRWSWAVLTRNKATARK